MITRIAVPAVLFLCLVTGSSANAGTFPFAPDENPDIVEGGVINNTDYTAVKKIESREITELYASFYIFDEYDSSRDGRYFFSVSPDEEGRFVLTASGNYEHELEISDKELQGAQSIIEKYDLVEKNGIDKVTSGLPPECGPMSLQVDYASGESLSFTENGNPDEKWALELKSCFEGIMEKAGFDDVSPPAEAVTIEKFDIAFNVDNLAYHYCEYTKSDGNTYLFREVYDCDSEEEISITFAELTAGYYGELQEVIEEDDVKSLHAPETVSFSQPWTSEGFVTIYVDYQNGRQIYAEYGPENTPENWDGIREDIQKFLDDYIERHPEG